MIKTMQWSQLLSNKRFGLEKYHEKHHDDRSEFQRDYDRLVFSSPFRRLQNKTQVFPLPGSIFVHNRLTHSLEVACVGRSLGNGVSLRLHEKGAQDLPPFIDEIGAIVSAGCLAHDLGNPPFGHSGEKAIATYFSEGKGGFLQKKIAPEEWKDIISFEGNANTFRLLTHQFKGRRKGGFVLTYSTLASVAKYPYASTFAPKGKQKFGFFQSEKDDFARIAEELGMIEIEKYRYARHPLVYLVEAADDICYEIVDIEDAHKLQILSKEETENLLLGFLLEKNIAHVRETMNFVTDTNEQIAYLRSCAVGELIKECCNTFVENEEEIMNGTFEKGLVQHLPERCNKAYKACQEVSVNKIYHSRDVVDIELGGYNIISNLIERLTEAVLHSEKAYSKILLPRISSQYEVNSPTVYGKIQAVLDFISGMTDVYALDLYQKINGLSLPAM